MRDRFNRVKPGERESVLATCWIIEYAGAYPCAIYLDKSAEFTCEPWEAKKFTNAAEALSWMKTAAPTTIDLDPFKPVERIFRLGTSAMSEANRI